MRKYLFLLSVLLLTSGVVFGDPTTAVVTNSEKAIQDPKTKVIYYLESDLRHIAAISPEGKLLWCCEVIRPTDYKGSYVAGIGFPEERSVQSAMEDVIEICYIGRGVGQGYINKRTGVFSATGMD